MNRIPETGSVMDAWTVGRPGPIDQGSLVRVTRAVPEPAPGEIRVRVGACGVCRTDLHLAEGDLAPRRPGVIPGHEVVGVVDALGAGCLRFGIGDRVGIAWLWDHLSEGVMQHVGEALPGDYETLLF